ncbi:hypothetical protein OPW07_00630 [Vibrio europaeus]|uniref:hypothetical protein n=1 Tax=Vibrio europaeus TaxID=300876 RepID=UPI0018A6E376|nr:hypothetical protein [Vibrio europaeus]MDC5808229.1 hypothetical protein [Vibrio europaeus]QPG37940.1 hypothetical protein IXK98_24830 [Vibrio europaeus]
MSSCNRCGNPIEFRYLDGQCIPIHIHGGCIDSGNSAINDYSGYRESKESTCFSTSCPECHDEVYFIRHNGGSVWVDAPLGSPWYQHACMHPPKLSSQKPTSLLSFHRFDVGSLPENTTMGVVKSCRVSYDKSRTELIVNNGKKRKLELVCKNNGGFLLGKLCVLDSNNEVIYSLEEPNLKYMLIIDITECPQCGVAVSKKNLKKHIRKKHSVKS